MCGIDPAVTADSTPVHLTSTSIHMSDTIKDATNETIDSYVTDMLALERHISTALAGQIEDLDEHSEFKGSLILLHTVCEKHVTALEALTARREQNVGGLSKVVKNVVSSVLGAGAAAIDFLRTEKLPKDLRDDYTALSLAYIGNLMLHTTALSLNDAEVASLARTHMTEHAESMMSLQHVIPAATIAFLAGEGLPVNLSVIPEVTSAIAGAWH